VIDQPALVAALTEGSIAGAGLDVYETEPHAPDALTAFPNVVLTPHVGGHTLESHVAMQDCVIANLEAFFAGKPLPYAVRKPESGIFRRTGRNPGRLNWREFCAWQSGKHSLNNRFRTCWPFAGTSVRAFRKPTR